MQSNKVAIAVPKYAYENMINDQIFNVTIDKLFDHMQKYVDKITTITESKYYMAVLMLLQLVEENEKQNGALWIKNKIINNDLTVLLEYIKNIEEIWGTFDVGLYDDYVVFIRFPENKEDTYTAFEYIDEVIVEEPKIKQLIKTIENNKFAIK